LRIHAHKMCLTSFLTVGVSFFFGLAGCGSPKPAEPQSQQPSEKSPQRYPLAGRVVSVNAASRQVVVDHGDIPGFMSAMTMPYSVKDPNQLAPLSPDDQIKADVVVNGDDVHLENIVVEKKAAPAKAPAAGSPKPASPGTSKP